LIILRIRGRGFIAKQSTAISPPAERAPHA
jgi:hypothetical protein